MSEDPQLPFKVFKYRTNIDSEKAEIHCYDHETVGGVAEKVFENRPGPKRKENKYFMAEELLEETLISDIEEHENKEFLFLRPEKRRAKDPPPEDSQPEDSQQDSQQEDFQPEDSQQDQQGDSQMEKLQQAIHNPDMLKKCFKEEAFAKRGEDIAQYIKRLAEGGGLISFLNKVEDVQDGQVGIVINQINQVINGAAGIGSQAYFDKIRPIVEETTKSAQQQNLNPQESAKRIVEAISQSTPSTSDSPVKLAACLFILLRDTAPEIFDAAIQMANKNENNAVSSNEIEEIKQNIIDVKVEIKQMVDEIIQEERSGRSDMEHRIENLGKTVQQILSILTHQAQKTTNPPIGTVEIKEEVITATNQVRETTLESIPVGNATENEFFN